MRARSSMFGLWLLLAVGCDPAVAPEDDPAVAPADDPAALEARRVAIRDQVKALIGDLSAAGKYDCCVEAPCNLCAMRAGGCKCGEGLRNGEPVCEECAMMWRRGNGAEPGVDAASVRSFLEAEREMEAKARGEVPPAASVSTPTSTQRPAAAGEAPGCACADHAGK
ncbi:MAG: hypothetical protein Q8P41_06815 [Pseudomonadota bacterium]|nr:hypothetical protein [Pseudomonadota bacterium]